MSGHRDQLAGRIVRVARWVLTSVSVAGAIYLAVVVFAGRAIFGWVGESNLALAFFSYLPPTIWLLPALVSLPAALLGWRPRILVIQILLVGGFFLFFMDYKWGGATKSDLGPEKALTVMTFNRGQQGKQSLKPFKKSVAPDILAFQDAARRGRRYAKDPAYQDLPHVGEEGEYSILSRYPIVSSEPITLDTTLGEGQPGSRKVAARFVIDYEGSKVALYNVHFYTPRSAIRSYIRGPFLYGVLGVPGTEWGNKRETYESYWDTRLEQVSEFLERVDSDPLPVLVVGDFNIPDYGRAYRLMRNELGDAHDAAGSGYGFTFPGTTRNPLSLFGPWLRIDYLFHGPEWEAVASVTESDRKSQHRAVAATFVLSPKSSEAALQASR